MSVWTKVSAVLSAEPDDWSMWAEAFSRHGIEGTVQTDRPPALSGYLSPGQDLKLDALRAELLNMGAVSIELEEVEEQDWSEAWKEFFKPRRVGEKFIVRPTWEEAEIGPGDLEIVLDPGQAFGTGDHPTTRGCLELIEQADCAGKSIADIGCGSGILSVGAGLLGAGELILVDYDPVCVTSSLENLKRNGVTGEVHEGLGFQPVAEGKQFDIVLSNIISAALIRLAPEAADRIKPGGLWIVSGIIEANWPDVLTRAQACGFELVETFAEGDWIAATLRR
ncbi:MAG: 50S ribosomal protein L11 methyltransferase [Armatimonadetes bacterium]|nr:50S ribosomal protein L11 methyltransferase [Armatimonadota bacterium]